MAHLFCMIHFTMALRQDCQEFGASAGSTVLWLASSPPCGAWLVLTGRNGELLLNAESNICFGCYSQKVMTDCSSPGSKLPRVLSAQSRGSCRLSATYTFHSLSFCKQRGFDWHLPSRFGERMERWSQYQSPQKAGVRPGHYFQLHMEKSAKSFFPPVFFPFLK